VKRRRRQPVSYNPLADARSVLRVILMEAGMDGLPAYDIALELKRRRPVLVPLLTDQLLTDWVRRQLDRMKDRDGLPLYRSVGLRYVQRAFWDEAAYREVIDRYVRGSTQNLTAARTLAEEAKHVLGVQIEVPTLEFVN
jgi:hypothetical protein